MDGQEFKGKPISPKQQCCYSKDGALIKTGVGAGTPDKSTGFEHKADDVKPFEWCCEKCRDQSLKDDTCKLYWGGARVANNDHCKGAAKPPHPECTTADLVFDGELFQLASDPNQNWTASSGDGDRRKEQMQGTSCGDLWSAHHPSQPSTVLAIMGSVCNPSPASNDRRTPNLRASAAQTCPKCLAEKAGC